MKPELKKLLVLNLPYLLFVYLFGKCGQAYRLAAGADASAKLLHLTDGISAAFASPLPSLHPFDLCVGIVGAVAVRLIVYSKGKNAKKYRKGEEYGSARWGTVKDIAPYIDPKFENNILLTQTERLTMTGRPKDPKTARTFKARWTSCLSGWNRKTRTTSPSGSTKSFCCRQARPVHPF